MPREYPWESLMEVRTREIGSLKRDEILAWFHRSRSQGLTDQDLYTLLAFASARYVDHHGPFIGHGTFNGGPVMRATKWLNPAYQDLALLQMALYVVDLCHHPNYGPYVLLEMMAVDEEKTSLPDLFLQGLESGAESLLTEHRVVALWHKKDKKMIHNLLLKAALRQYPENEHRLLMVYYTLQFLEDTDYWGQAEPLLRASIQYLASRPNITFVSDLRSDRPLWPQGGHVSSEDTMMAVQKLVSAPYGQEPHVFADLIATKVSGASLIEASSLAASLMLSQSGFDAHAVTGVHCILDLLADPKTPQDAVNLAGYISLSSSRTRRQKAKKLIWPWPDLEESGLVSLEDIRSTVGRGNEAQSFSAVRSYLTDGGDAKGLTKLLMEIALETSGSFSAIHNVKMLWGMYHQTRRSELPGLSWLHLAAGARVIAQTVTSERDEAKDMRQLFLI